MCAHVRSCLQTGVADFSRYVQLISSNIEQTTATKECRVRPCIDEQLQQLSNAIDALAERVDAVFSDVRRDLANFECTHGRAVHIFSLPFYAHTFCPYTCLKGALLFGYTAFEYAIGHWICDASDEEGRTWIASAC